MRVTETLRAGKVIAVVAKAKGSGKTTRKTVAVGGRTVSLASGQTQPFTIPLNSTGKRLLSSHHGLKVKLEAAQSGASIFTTVLNFKTTGKHASRLAVPVASPGRNALMVRLSSLFE